MERLCIDFVNVPAIIDGPAYLLTVIDQFTRYPWAFPLKTKNAEEIAEVLLVGVFLPFGFPREIHSDNELALTTEVLNILWAKVGVQRTVTSVNNPGANGPIERFHAYLHFTMTTSIENFNLWDKFVPTLLFCYRVAPNVTTLHSPFFLMFGRQANLPMNLVIKRPLSERERKLELLNMDSKRRETLRRTLMDRDSGDYL